MIPAPADENRATLEVRLAEALKFLGHDAREGHSSTLALLELQRIRPEPMTLAQLAERITANARKSLAAIDDFVDLSRARGQALRLDRIDLLDLLIEAVADAWPIANAQGVRIQVAEQRDVVMGWADRELVTSALAKLLRDAIAKSPRGSAIGCALGEERQGCEFRIDAPAARGGAEPGAPADPGRGGARPTAGIVLAQAVAERHRGSVQVDASSEERSVLRLWLPAQAPQ